MTRMVAPSSAHLRILRVWRFTMSDNDTNQQDPNELKSKLIFAVVAIFMLACAKFLGW